MRFIQNSRLRILVLVGLVGLLQCCCCIIPLHWQSQFRQPGGMVQQVVQAIQVGFQQIP